MSIVDIIFICVFVAVMVMFLHLHVKEDFQVELTEEDKQLPEDAEVCYWLNNDKLTVDIPKSEELAEKQKIADILLLQYVENMKLANLQATDVTINKATASVKKKRGRPRKKQS